METASVHSISLSYPSEVGLVSDHSSNEAPNASRATGRANGLHPKGREQSERAVGAMLCGVRYEQLFV
jgi:hypothetical protein